MTSEVPRRETVVVTGAGGYVGRHVVTDLLDRGHAVRAVVRQAGADVDPRATTVIADVLDPSTDVASIVGETSSRLIHLAWQDGFQHNAPTHMGNLSAHVRFIETVAHLVDRVVVLGTMHEVGYWEGAITAETPTAPRSQYGIAKDALRRSLMLSSESWERAELSWVRCFYIHGDDRRNKSIFARLLDAVDEGKESIPFTTGRNRYDFIDVRALADQISAVALTAGATGVINCCSGVPVALADQVESFIADKGLPIRLDYGAFPDRPYDSPAVWGDATRVREILNQDRSNR